MTINLHLPSKAEALRPSITVVGVGGAGGNAVNNMISSNLEGVNFVVANTDAQAMENSLAERRIQLGANITRGLGAGAMPDVGRAAAEEAREEIESYIDGSNMVFITAGMGGGTGTGAAPVVARMAKERGILTVGVVTKPFQFEGLHRMRIADQGVLELQQYVDTLIVIPNQNLFRIINERTPFAEAFRMADEVLHSGVRGVTDLIVMPGLINLDFADIRTVMGEMGKAMMGTGEAEGGKRAVEAAEAAIQNPLLDDFSMKGAKGVLINITGGYDMTLFEVDEAANRIRAEVDPTANIIFGATFNTSMEGRMRVSVVATGIEIQANTENLPRGVAPVAAIAPVQDTRRSAYTGSFGFGGQQQPAAPVSRGLRPAPEAPRAPEPARVEAQPVYTPEPVYQQPVEAVAAAVQQQPVQQYGTMGRIRTAVGAANAVQLEPMEAAIATATSTFIPPRSSEPSFISPQVEQPVQRSFFNQQASENDTLHFAHQPAAAGAASAQQADYAPRRTAMMEPALQPSPREKEANPGGGFFQRMARVKDAFTSSAAPETPPARAIRAQEKPKFELTKNDPKREEAAAVGSQTARASLEEDYLDIPAFLRRQAN